MKHNAIMHIYNIFFPVSSILSYAIIRIGKNATISIHGVKHDAYSKTYPQKAYATANKAFIPYTRLLYFLLISAYIATDMNIILTSVIIDMLSNM